MTEPLSNGHDDTAAEIISLCDAVDVAGGAMSAGSVVLKEQLRAVQIGAARHSERMTVEALAQDSVRRLAEAYQANNWQRAAEILREICRLEIYLSKRGFT
jgi:hypothetical protein